MRVDGLAHTENNPDVHGQDVKITGDACPDDGRTNGAKSEHHDFDWRSVFGCQSKGRRVLVMDLVDVLVQRTPVHRTMHPVMPCVLNDEENGNLVRHLVDARERDGGAQAEVLAQGVEKPNLGRSFGAREVAMEEGIEM